MRTYQVRALHTKPITVSVIQIQTHKRVLEKIQKKKIDPLNFIKMTRSTDTICSRKSLKPMRSVSLAETVSSSI